MIAIAVDEVVEGDVGDQSGLYPFPDEQTEHCGDASASDREVNRRRA